MSNKYKLIKIFPTSNCNLGDIVSFNEKNESWEIIEGFRNGELLDEDLECNKYPEFWELVKQDPFQVILDKLKVKLTSILPYNTPKNKKEIRLNNIAKLQLVEEYYADKWILNWNDRNEYKYYPHFIKENGVWRVLGVCYYYYFVSGGSLAYYQTKEKALKAANNHLDLYISIIDPK